MMYRFIQHVQAQAENASSKIIFSKGIKLTDEQMKGLLPYCNALDFEPFRNREMSMDDPGYRGYRDENACINIFGKTF